MKKYIKPKVKVWTCIPAKMLACSENVYDHICTDMCRWWHSCLDRQKGMTCYDKKY